MNKRIRVFIYSVVTFILVGIISLSLLSGAAPLETFNGKKDVNLSLELFAGKNILQGKFRKTSDLSAVEDKNLNLKGLNKLNISGSKQFDVSTLPILVKGIGTSLPVTVVDLRQESHGFVNEFSVSWVGEKNNANVGLTRKQVLAEEAKNLKSIKLNEPLTFYNHPKNTIIPTKVQDEDKLVKSNNLSYKRITVRDGGIPEDDMVDYFVKFAKEQSKNSWLHFHCKQGMGRTGTFMIMYDMMKNCNEVSAEDIIKRELALGNYDEEQVKSFKNNERMNFLQKFYDYCKENSNSFDVKWSKWKGSKNTTTTSSIVLNNKTQKISGYVKNPILPEKLYVISQDSMTNAEKTMIASLQGIVNGHTTSQIYTLSSSQPDYGVWLSDLNNNYKIPYEKIQDPWQLLKIYKDKIDGYILYSNKNSKDPSINNACSLASLNNSIVVDESIESKVINNGITKINGDCRNTDQNWAYNNLWNKGLNHSTVIQISPDKAAPLRDYAIMSKSLVFYEDSINKTALREKVFSSMGGNSVCMGWGPDEFINVSIASKCGTSLVAADWSYNLTVLSAFPLQDIVIKPDSMLSQKGNFHYVTFIMSDGDNQQWNLGSNYTSNKWYGYSNRDKLSLGWSMSPSIYYLAPTVFKMYYDSISNEDKYNNFIVAPSGNGYMYPSKFKRSKLNTYINVLNDYMKRSGERYISVIDDMSFNNVDLWNKFTQKSNIDGIFYLDYKKHDNFKGQIVWSNNKPIVSCRDLLWDNIESEDELVKKINSRVDSGEVNESNSKAYTFVYIHVWSKSTENVNYVINKLKANPNVKVVTPEVFMKLIKDSVKH